MSVVLSKHLPLLATAPDGIQKLRGLILELAVRGKLVPQDPNDEPASELLKRIAHEKDRLSNEEGLRTTAEPQIAADEHYVDLPIGWRFQRLGNLAKFIDYRGKTPNKINAGVPLITAKNVRFGFISREPFEFISEKEYVEWMTRGFPRVGDILFTTEAPLGNVAIVDIKEKFALAQRVICFQFHEPQIAAYLRLALMSEQVRQQIGAEATGMTATGIKASRLKEIPVPLPPLAEQYRIVAKVDELMALCDRLEAEQADVVAAHAKLVDTLLGTLTESTDAADLAANWQRLAEHFDTIFTTESSLDALKQTILQLGVMGKLVPQDPNDEPASKLMQRIGNTKVEGKTVAADFPFELPMGWNIAQLKDLLEPGKDLSYGIIKLGAEPASDGIWTLRCSDVKPGYIDLSSVRRVSKEIECEYRRTRLSGGEIVLNIRGTLGGVAIIPDDLAGYNVAREVAVIPVSQHLNNRYLLFAMLSPYFWRTTLEELRGIAYKGLNLGSLRTFNIPIPPLREQHRIVTKVDELMALCDALKTDLAESRHHQARLASTLIESAFEAA